jgi:hypothetical protein
MLIAATSIFVYYTIWTLFMVRVPPLTSSSLYLRDAY